MEPQFQFSNRHHDLMARDREYIYGWRYEPRIMFESGRGIVLKDIDGNEYFDLTAGMMCMVLGHSHPELTETIRDQADKLVHESSWYSNPWLVEFAELIASTLPGDLKVVNFAVTGSEANEIAMRLALGVTGKFDIVSLIRGLHGGSLAAESVTSIGGGRKAHLGPLMMPAHRNAIYAPFCYRCPINLEYPACDVACLDRSEELMEHITSRSVAAILAETIPVAGGMVVPPPEWLPRLAELAKRWGALLVLDEAQLAPAKTGRIWGFENYGVVPDVVAFGKGMTAGFGIAGTVTTEAIAEEARYKAGLPWAGTYSGDPFPAAVALKQLQIVLRDGLADRSNVLGERLGSRLEALPDRHEAVGCGPGHGALLDARHRQGRQDPGSRSGDGRAHPVQRGAGRFDPHCGQELHSGLSRPHHYRGRDRRGGRASGTGDTTRSGGISAAVRLLVVELPRRANGGRLTARRRPPGARMRMKGTSA